MIIGGFQKQSLIDYPGKICSIVFTVGCNFRCPYCHNSELVLPEKIKTTEKISEDFIFNYLEKNRKLLDAVEITGGEPTLQKDLPDFIKKLKSMKFLVKLDTNGTNPKVVKFLIDEKLIDYVAMDVKAPLEKYEEIVNAKFDTNLIKESIELLINSGIDYEFRTTAYPKLKEEDFIEIGKLIVGAKKYYIQQFDNKSTLANLTVKPYSLEELQRFAEAMKPFVKNVKIRNV